VYQRGPGGNWSRIYAIPWPARTTLIRPNRLRAACRMLVPVMRIADVFLFCRSPSACQIPWRRWAPRATLPRLGSWVRIPSPAPNSLIEFNSLRRPRKRSPSFLTAVNTWSTPELRYRPRKLKHAPLGGKPLLLSRTDDRLTRLIVGQILYDRNRVRYPISRKVWGTVCFSLHEAQQSTRKQQFLHHWHRLTVSHFAV
jgi:hypothetical protein